MMLLSGNLRNFQVNKRHLWLQRTCLFAPTLVLTSNLQLHSKHLSCADCGQGEV